MENSLNELAKAIHENAIVHGWWDEERSFGEIIALCHSELSEALEEYRDGKPNLYYNCEEVYMCCWPRNPCNPKDETKCLNFAAKDSLQWLICPIRMVQKI